LLTLRWGPSGVAFAWTASYFLLMFPAFWYAGKPIGLGIFPMLSAVWKFFAASILAALATLLIFRAMPYFTTAFGARGALIRMVSISLVFFCLYLGGVVALHKSLKPLNETAGLIREVLPERLLRPTIPASANAKVSDAVSRWRNESNLQPDFATVPDDNRAEL